MSTQLNVAGKTVSLGFDADTGALNSIALDEGDRAVRIPTCVSAVLVVGGHEERGATGGIEYVDTTMIELDRADGPPTVVKEGQDLYVSVSTSSSGWHVEWVWRLRSGAEPGVSLALEVTGPETSNALLRDMHLDVTVEPAENDGWIVDAPGNMLRRGVPLANLPATTRIEPPAGSMGSSGVVQMRRDGVSLVLWPLCTTELADIVLSPVTSSDGNRAIRLHLDTHLAGDLSGRGSVVYEGLRMDIARRTPERTLDAIHAWYQTFGISAPNDVPEWVRTAVIFEVFIGRAVFWNGHDYAPYPTVRTLIDDLDRIQSIGMTAIQLMPQHPYPSYNIHDFDDVTTSYGNEPELIELVSECHRRGMRVILDVLLHGVLDGESITAAADRVRTGPIAGMLESSPGDLFAAGPGEGWRYEVSWSRHILDFEPYWVEGAPAVSPLVAEHPDWFYRNSAGDVSGIYTKAIDVRIAGAREWMIASLIKLAQRLDVDGFRLDAPTYNRFANWSQATRHRASASTLACLDMFRELRPRVRAWKGDFMLYTEPSGILHRETMDLTYNYDEQWLVGAGLGQNPDRAAWAVSDGRSMAQWLEDRDALLPEGSLTCHHVDSHDTFWWPQWGEKWRREQFGDDATGAMVAAFMLCGGPYMVFTGGELGLEKLLRRLAGAKKDFPALQGGLSDFGAVHPDNESVFAVVRYQSRDAAIVLVNMSESAVTVSLSLSGVVATEGDLAVGAEGTSVRVGPGSVTAELSGFGWCVVPASRP